MFETVPFYAFLRNRLHPEGSYVSKHRKFQDEFRFQWKRSRTNQMLMTHACYYLLCDGVRSFTSHDLSEMRSAWRSQLSQSHPRHSYFDIRLETIKNTSIKLVLQIRRLMSVLPNLRVLVILDSKEMMITKMTIRRPKQYRYSQIIATPSLLQDELLATYCEKNILASQLSRFSKKQLSESVVFVA